MNPAHEILKNLIGELKGLARTETVVGAPIVVGDLTLIPISRVSLGVGAGGGSGEGDKKAPAGEGGGGGGGVRITPVALVSIRGPELSIHTVGPGSALGHTVEKIPDLLERTIEKVLDAWQSRQTQDEKSVP